MVLAIATAMPADPDEAAALELVLRVEPPEESPEPRSITVEGRFGPRERAVLQALCEALDARCFDLDSGDFLRF